MKFYIRTHGTKQTLSVITLIVFSLIAGASAEDIGIYAIILVVIVCIVGIITYVTEMDKKESLHDFESSMTDFTISQKVLCNNESALYYDEKQEKIRVVAIKTKGCISKDYDNVIMKSVTNCINVANHNCLFIIDNEKEKNTIIAKTKEHDIAMRVIDNFEPETIVCNDILTPFFAADKNNKKILVLNDYEDYNIINFKDINKVEIIENEQLVSSKSSIRTIGGATLGGVLAGGAGAVVGGLSGKTRTSKEIDGISVKIFLRDINNPIIVINIFEGKLDASKSLEEYKKITALAYKIEGIISAIIDQNDNGSQLETSNENKSFNTLSISEEISKLATLKEKGVISEEEFISLKTKLLNQQ